MIQYQFLVNQPSKDDWDRKDHLDDIEYGDQHWGVIPKGYGAGTVSIWDNGEIEWFIILDTELRF